MALSPSSVSPTDVVQCTITATDADGESVDSSDSVQVSNSAPSVSGVSIQPASGVTTSSSVSCSATVSDADAEQLSATYAWSNGSTGVALGSGASVTLSAQSIQPGESVVCTASVTDGYGASDSRQRVAGGRELGAGDRIGDHHPANPYNDDSLNCAASASDADGQTLTTSVNWVNASSGAGLGMGANLTLSAATAMPGETIECTVDVDDGAGQRQPEQQRDSGQPGPGSAGAGDLAPPRDLAGHAGVRAQQRHRSGWRQRHADLCLVCEQHCGSGRDGVDLWWVAFLRRHGGLHGDHQRWFLRHSTMGSATLTLTNTPPVIDSLVLSPDPVRTDDALTATVVASDAEGDAITLDYTWSVNGAAVQNGANNSLASSNYVRGNIVSVTVTPSDANATGPSAIDGLTVANTAPTAPAVALSPASPVEGIDDLVCSASGSSDADGDSVSYSYSWTVDGVVWRQQQWWQQHGHGS